MAANKAQGQGLTIFLIGITVGCAGIAALDSGLGKLALLIGIVALAFSFLRFLQLKPLEGKIALHSQPAAAKLIGVAVALLGWVVVLLGLHVMSGVGGRMLAAIVGVVISLTGVIYLLPAACNKNAIWKP